MFPGKKYSATDHMTHVKGAAEADGLRAFMLNNRLGNKQKPAPSFTGSISPVEVIKIVEIVLIHQTDPLHHRSLCW